MEAANDIETFIVFDPFDNTNVFITADNVYISSGKEESQRISAETGEYCNMQFGPTDRLKITINEEMIFITATHDSPNHTLRRMLQAKIAAGDAKPTQEPGPLVEIRIPRAD